MVKKNLQSLKLRIYSAFLCFFLKNCPKIEKIKFFLIFMQNLF